MDCRVRQVRKRYFQKSFNNLNVYAGCSGKITAAYREEGTLIHNVKLTGLYRPIIGEKPATEDISLGENVDLAAYWLVYSEEKVITFC